uniref:Uncharacterized protein n=1 Tax=Salix viminalis TaxID=40686 RepID=A0A6N2L9X8_SALVM
MDHHSTIESISKLRRAGIKLRQGIRGQFLGGEIQNGIRAVSQWFFMHSQPMQLFWTADVEHLCDCNIIENTLVRSQKCKIDHDRQRILFCDVHDITRTKTFAMGSFKYTYFRTPWSFVSALAALIILLLTVAQTFYTIYGTYRKKP